MPSGIKRTLRRLERYMGLRSELELKTVLTSAEFEQELSRQQSFADRTGVQFFLLRFFLDASVPGSRDHEEAMELLAEAVRGRMRLSDIAGRWTSPEDSIGLVLCGARPEGVVGVIKAISDAFHARIRRKSAVGESGPFLSGEVRSFPNGNGGQPFRLEDGSSETPAPGPS